MLFEKKSLPHFAISGNNEVICLQLAVYWILSVKRNDSTSSHINMMIFINLLAGDDRGATYLYKG
ncbi:hypothetical protein KSU1_A0009 [Candidatus Jettenia caeni]|uniref:Uncharacterized protein n=1 Tax=Candidatus Jettenia caeni TaxID=247490 RepID=I3IGD1_9BACT|nr:MAG: hypothetical protein EDM77_10010 [Candidatus Jettenia sp. AMX1]MCE7881890.1 hypothetical protein [Candidatus Jettenia sp. AMX1]MCQ3927040.1 hypothetical protein [Candidatus Jettenia sp.]GAB60776.1 hypothetical protein KSU1_A0009 [Candidatus Jettenia caeni]